MTEVKKSSTLTSSEDIIDFISVEDVKLEERVLTDHLPLLQCTNLHQLVYQTEGQELMRDMMGTSVVALPGTVQVNAHGSLYEMLINTAPHLIFWDLPVFHQLIVLRRFITSRYCN